MLNLVHNLKSLFFSDKCPICQEETDGNHYICNSCYLNLLKKASLKNINNYYYIYIYENEIKKVIADFKLNFRKNISVELAGLIKKHLLYIIKLHEIDTIIPVPISKKRLKERGFNQVEEILKSCNIKYSCIYRQKDTKHMYQILNAKKREKNITNAFKNKNLNFNNKNILIVDDIVTTGATTQEIIKEIYKNHTPANIFIFSIALSKTFIYLHN